MQRCPKCNRIYTEGTFTFCLDDGALLSAPDNHEETETVIISKPPIPEPAPTALTSQIAQKSNKLFWIVGSAAILVFGTALILYLQTNSLKSSRSSSDETNQTNNLSIEEAVKRGIAATVNDRPIMLDEVDRAMKQSLQNKTEEMSSSQLRTARLNVLDSLIDREVIFQRAEKEQLLPTEDEVATTINTSKQESGLTQEGWQKQLKEAGETESSWRELVRKGLAVEKLTKKIFNQVELPNDSEIEAFFNTNYQDKNLKLDTPGVRQMVRDALIEQRKKALIEEFSKAVKNGAKIVNYLAASKIY